MRIVRRLFLLNARSFVAVGLCSVGIVLAGASVGANAARRVSPTAATTISATAAAGNWSIVSSPNSRPTPTDNFPGEVACVSGTDCWAVGYYNNVSAYQTLIQHWDGNAWTIVNSPNTRATQHNLLRSVTCTSATDCWSVGSYLNDTVYQSLIEHWDGTSWSIVDSPNSSATQYNYLLGVTCASASQCWAVGYYSNGSSVPQTLIERWDGISWTISSSPNTSPSQENILYGIACSSSSNCWAVGSSLSNNTTGIYQTLIERWDGNVWTIVTSPNTLPVQNNYLYSVSCASAGACWAVGYYNSGVADQTLIATWNGSSWSIANSPNTMITQNNRLNDVNCGPGSQCWAVGYSNNGSNDQTIILKWDGSSWSAISSPNGDSSHNNTLRGVACGSNLECWAVGSFNNSSVQQSLLAKWDGISWSMAPSPNANAAQNNTLLGITCPTSSDCRAVGSYYNGSVQQTLVQRWDGIAWQIVNSPNSSPTQNNILYDVTCTSATDCWIIGYHDNGSAFQTLTEHWDGNVWSIVDSPSTSPTQNNFLSDIVCPNASQCWAVGYYDNGNAYQTLIERWDGNSWTIVDSPNTSATLQNRLHGVTCSPAGDCWTVGRYFDGLKILTLIEHWDGTLWTIVTSPNNGSANENILWGVTCAAGSDCWAVGSYGAGDGTGQPLVEHWDGASWMIVSAPMPTSAQYNYNFLRSVTCTEAGTCIASGYYFSDGYDHTLVERWDGQNWTIGSSPNTSAEQNNFLFGLTCLSSFECWAAGYHYDDGGVIQTLIEHFIAPPPLLKIISVERMGGGQMMVNGQGESSMTVTIQATSDLTQRFETIGSVTPDADGSFQFQDSDSVDLQRRFYRAVYP